MSWYEIIQGEHLAQGDVLRQMPVVSVLSIPAQTMVRDDVAFDLLVADVIVVSQSCDLEQGNLEWILVAQMESWVETVTREKWGRNKRLAQQKRIRRGHSPNFLLLDECGETAQPYAVVDFRSLYTLPVHYVKEHAISLGDRPRLRAPYREHLSQSFGRYMMRVALDEDPIAFDSWDPPTA